MFQFFKNLLDKNFYPSVKKKNGQRTKIFVGISGGVDSSVAAKILLDKGYQVEGVFFKKYTLDKEKCQQEKKDAEKICQQLGIPFHFLDLEKEYKEKILSYFIETYREGKTPNPDIFCNREIKFGAFQKWAFEQGADFIATGHYAKNVFNKKTNLFELHRAKDQDKDQTYFLSMLTQEQLKGIIFPLGNLEKKEVRKIAQKNNLITAQKKDSQGICFLGTKIDLKEFLKKHIPEKKGKVVNLLGQVIGEHQGVWFYTLGERHGFEIFPEAKTPETPRLFVVKKDLKNNILVVGSKEELEKQKSLKNKEVVLEKVNWISKEPDFTKKYLTKVRYRGEEILGKISYYGPERICRAEICVEEELMNEKIKVIFDREHKFVTPGQVVVFYEGDKCLGGGVIV